MSRRAPATLAATAALLLVAPQGAQAQACQVPKAWETAALQLQYELALELGLTEHHTRELARTPSSQLGDAAARYAAQRATGAAYLARALGRFAGTLTGNPPACARRRR